MRDWLYVEDHCARARSRRRARAGSGEKYNIGGGNERTQHRRRRRRICAHFSTSCGPIAAPAARVADHLRRRPAGPRPPLRDRRRARLERELGWRRARDLRDRHREDGALVSRQRMVVATARDSRGERLGRAPRPAAHDLRRRRADAHEGHHSGRRRRHAAASDHLRSQQAAVPVYDKPMIYYPLSTLMLAGIREILIISTPARSAAVPPAARRRLASWGMSDRLRRAAEPERAGPGVRHRPRVHRRRPGRRWCSATTSSTARACSEQLRRAPQRERGATVFAYHVPDPERYGVVEFDARRPSDLDRGKARKRRSRTGPSPGSISTTSKVVDIAKRAQAVGARRVRDHRRQSRLSRSRRAERRAHGPRLRLARHRDARLVGRRGELRADARDAAGRPRSAARKRSPSTSGSSTSPVQTIIARFGKSAYGQYLGPCSRSAARVPARR